MDTIIEFKNIKKVYGENVIIENFSLKINRGEFVTIIGSSGSGKTTLLKMINGIITPDSGDIFVNGKNIKEVDIIELRRNIGYAIQGSVLFPHLTIEKNIAYVPSLLNKDDKEKTHKAVEKWVSIVGLEKEMLNRYPSELSGGQQQRVGIARSLAASPELALMDEPFGAVDEITRESLQDEVLKIYNALHMTILFVTHDINEALKLGTKVLVINDGKIDQYDTVDNLIRHPKTSFVEQLVKKEREICHLE